VLCLCACVPVCLCACIHSVYSSLTKTVLHDVVLTYRRSARQMGKMPKYNDAEDEDEEEEEEEDSAMEEGSEVEGSGKEETNKIDKILGMKGEEDSQEYLIKNRGQSYLHLVWLDKETVEAMPGGRARLKNLAKKEEEAARVDVARRRRLVRNRKRRSTQLDEGDPNKEEKGGEKNKKEEDDADFLKGLVEAGYIACELIKIDRVLARRSGSDGSEYLVKWQTLPYDEASWETESDLKRLIPNWSKKLRQFKAREKLPPESQRVLVYFCFVVRCDGLISVFVINVRDPTGGQSRPLLMTMKTTYQLIQIKTLSFETTRWKALSGSFTAGSSVRTPSLLMKWDSGRPFRACPSSNTWFKNRTSGLFVPNSALLLAQHPHH